MTVARYSVSRNPITLLFSNLFWQVQREPFIATDDDFPPARTADWLNLTDFRIEEEVYLNVTGSTAALEFATREQTQPTTDLEMLRLDAAAHPGNEIAFSRAAEAVEWNYRSPRDLERAIRLALQAGAHLKARQLSELAAQRYPGHTELQKFAQILAPPRVIDAHVPADPNARADMEWLKTHGDEHRGQWVAIQNGRLLASATSMRKLLDLIGNPKGTGIMVTRAY